MKQAFSGAFDTTSALVTLLATRRFAMTDLLTINLPFGPGGASAIRYCNADLPVTFESLTYKGMGSRMDLPRLRIVRGLEVDSLELKIRPFVAKTGGNPDLVPDWLPSDATISLFQAASAGLFDGATVSLRRLFTPKPPIRDIGAVGAPVHIDAAAGAVTLFVGSVSDIDVTRDDIVFQVHTLLQKLNTQWPRNVYQPGCLNTLYDSICLLSRTGSFGGNNFQQAATVNAGSSNALTVVLNSSTPQPAGYFDLGYLTLTSGGLEGLKRPIKQHGGNVVILGTPFPFPWAASQPVLLQAGCDKSLDTCVAKFNNRAAFRGFPFIPMPDTAL